MVNFLVEKVGQKMSVRLFNAQPPTPSMKLALRPPDHPSEEFTSRRVWCEPLDGEEDQRLQQAAPPAEDGHQQLSVQTQDQKADQQLASQKEEGRR